MLGSSTKSDPERQVHNQGLLRCPWKRHPVANADNKPKASSSLRPCLLEDHANFAGEEGLHAKDLCVRIPAPLKAHANLVGRNCSRIHVDRVADFPTAGSPPR